MDMNYKYKPKKKNKSDYYRIKTEIDPSKNY
jgi:hypothetical protein